MDRATKIDLISAFVAGAAPSIGWSVRAVRRSRSSLSRYVELEAPDGCCVVVRVSDHRAHRPVWDRRAGNGFFSVVLGNVAKLAELPAFLGAWATRGRSSVVDTQT